MTEFDPSFEAMHPQQRAVVYVDDEADGGLSQKMMIFQLDKGCAQRGMLLKIFTQPELALDFILGNDHNNIVMMTDNNMPGLSGAELVYALEEKGKLPQTVLFSGLSTEVGKVPASILVLDRVKDGKRAATEIFIRADRLKTVEAPSIEAPTPAASVLAK